MTVTDELLAELEDAASKATPQHLDSAEDVIMADSGAMIECPVCGGEGYASIENEYCNFDNHAIGVQFYGIGPEFGAAEEYYRRANPATITALTAELRRLRAENAGLAKDAGRFEELAKQANVNCRNTAYYLRKHRPDLATICSGWCDAIDTAMATQ